MQQGIQDSLKKSTEFANSPIAQYSEPLDAKGEEVAVATKAIETKTAGASELAVAIATDSADAEDTQESLAVDTAMRANLAKSCAAKLTEYGARRKLMAEKVTAISQSISMAHRDDAPDTSTKTVPFGDTAAFMQTGSRLKHQPKRITEILTPKMPRARRTIS